MGMLGRIKRGSWPWPLAPYGYTREAGDESLTLDPEAADTVRTIYRLCLEGKSLRYIARYLNQLGKKPMRSEFWFTSSLKRILRNPTYVGLIPFRGHTYKGKYEAIIDEDSWNRVQSLLDRRRAFGGRAVASDRLLVGLLRCGHCGGVMTSHHVAKSGKRSASYRCRRYRDSGRATCRPNSHSENKLMSALMSTIAQHAQDDELLSQMLAAQDRRSKAELTREREAIFEALSKMDQRSRRQWLAYEKGKIDLDEFADSRFALKQEEEKLQGALASVEAALTRRITKDTLRTELGRLAASWQELERHALKAALANVIETIAIYDEGRLEITYSS